MPKDPEPAQLAFLQQEGAHFLPPLSILLFLFFPSATFPAFLLNGSFFSSESPPAPSSTLGALRMHQSLFSFDNLFRTKTTRMLCLNPLSSWLQVFSPFSHLHVTALLADARVLFSEHPGGSKRGLCTPGVNPEAPLAPGPPRHSQG